MGGKGSGGHNRKPTAQKLAEGNRGKRPLNVCETKALPGEPPMPSGMTEQARAVWPEVVAMLKANDVLFKTDGLAIATLCSNLVLFWQADRAVQELGSVREWRMNPSVRVRSDAEKKLRACWQLFGLDPSSRPGVQVDRTKRDPQSALDSVLRAKSTKDEIINWMVQHETKWRTSAAESLLAQACNRTPTVARYTLDVLTGNVAAGRLVLLAIERFLNDLERSP